MNIRIISLLAATTLLTAPAIAADNYNVKEAAGATIAKAAKDVTSVWFDKQICVTLADTTIDCFTELNASLRAEDTASGDADSGMPIFAVRKATPANTSNTDGDYEALQISAGRLWTDAGALLPTSLGAKVGTASLSVVPASDGFGVNATQAGTWNVTNVSGTVSLPTGAATAAKQPALGTAGSSSADVITVQGIASGTNLNVNCQVGCSGGTAYTEDVAAAADPVGLAVISRRRDTLSASEVSADGDNIGLISTNKGELRINDNSLNTAIGTTADSAWASGSGSAISLLKTIATASLDTTPASVKIDQTTPGTTNAVSLAQLGANTVSTGNGTAGTGTLRVSLASDSTGQVTLAAGTATVGATFGFAGTATTTITRPADTTAYTANDAFADSTSAPTSGGFTLSSMCRASGGSGVLTDAAFIYSTSSAVAGTVYIYDSSVTAQNDNAAWSVSDSDQLKLVGTIPFATVADGANAIHNVQNLNMGYTCSGSANLRYMVKITTGYTPASGDTLTIRAKFIQSN